MGIKLAVCNVCRKEVENPWMLDGWKPVCQPCFDSFRAKTGAKVEPKKVAQPAKTKEAAPEPRRVEALSPGAEPFVILYPEDSMLMDGQPQPWRDLWDKSKIKNALDAEKTWPDTWAELPEKAPGEEE